MSARCSSGSLIRQRGDTTDKFPYGVIYLVQPEHVWIVAIMHLNRVPGYWHERAQ